MKVVITGGSGGIGSAFVHRLAGRPNVETVTATYHRSRPAVEHPKVTWQRLDLSDESAIHAWAAIRRPTAKIRSSRRRLHRQS